LSFAPIYEVDKSGADKKNQSFIIFWSHKLILALFYLEIGIWSR
jgi:hypothetical protein